MNSRQRLQAALNHQEPDRPPIDLGGCSVTGMHVSVVYKLRQALGLDTPGTPVKVIRPYLMIVEIAEDLLNALGIGVAGVAGSKSSVGDPLDNWKQWSAFDGTPVLVPGDFNTEVEPNGDLLQYPQGDKSAPPSAVMPKDGWYFDAIIRQPPVDEDNLDPRDNMEEFQPMADSEIELFRQKVEHLYANTDKAIMANFGGSGFGDIAAVPAMQLKQPMGIRDIAEWYLSLATRPEYIYKVFERQCEIALNNLERLYAAVGNKVDVVYLTGTDFGMQRGLLVRPDIYRALFQPFHKILNDWIHKHTTWKTFIHSCGCVTDLIEDFIDAGFDILNPLQFSAGIDPVEIKRRFGNRIAFWGGGVDTQRTLPFGTPEEVRSEVRERLRILAPGGGFVFNAIHNIQALTPVENVLALFEAAREWQNDTR